MMFFKILLWTFLTCLAFLGALMLLILIALIVKGLRNENTKFSDDFYRPVDDCYWPEGEGDKSENNQTEGRSAVDSSGE